MGFRKAFLLAGVTAISLTSLTACESVDTAMRSVKDTFASMEMDMPEITPTNKGYGLNGETEESTEPTAMVASNGAAETVDKMQPAKSIQAEDLISVNNVQISQSGNCPAVSVISDLDALHQFTSPEHPKPEDKISSITLTSLQSKCQFNNNNVAIELDLKFAGELGPRARVWNTDKPSFAYPYFLAITTSDGNIIAKEVFAATITYDKNSDVTTHEESLRQIIPLNGEYGRDTEIMLGFQLTEGELAYNRSLKGVPAYVRADEPPAYIETSAGTEEAESAITITITPQRKPAIAVKETETKEVVIEAVKEEVAEETTEVVEEASEAAEATDTTGETLEASMPEPSAIPASAATEMEEEARKLSDEMENIVSDATKEVKETAEEVKQTAVEESESTADIIDITAED